MSYSLRLINGELATKGSQLDVVFGMKKLEQDVDLWLRERYGGDRFHPTMGSILQEFIGQIIEGSTMAEVQAEVMRVLQNYQAVQLRRLREAPQRMAPSELLVSIDDIIAQVSFDAILVAVRLRNGADATSTVSVGQGV